MSASSAYVDSSVILRIVLMEPNASLNLKKYSKVFASRLLRVECYRVIHRLSIQGELIPENSASAQQRLRFLMQGLNILALTDEIMQRAEEPLPLALGTLDTLHLVSARHIRDNFTVPELAFLTHDDRLGQAARALGFTVLGIQ